MRVRVRQKRRVIYDTQTEGASVIDMCLGTLRADRPVCWWAESRHTSGEIVFTSLLEH